MRVGVAHFYARGERLLRTEPDLRRLGSQEIALARNVVDGDSSRGNWSERTDEEVRQIAP